mmetsp:Transcript_39115/g.85792  ORF Transcript_39115/g.85792 Transcript_39115/m.85792 type:complete len:107 (-) Transcript_39115:26-346(-)
MARREPFFPHAHGLDLVIATEGRRRDIPEAGRRRHDMLMRQVKWSRDAAAMTPCDNEGRRKVEGAVGGSAQGKGESNGRTISSMQTLYSLLSVVDLLLLISTDATL